MTSKDDFITQQLWYLHKSPRQTLVGIIAKPRDLATEKIMNKTPLHRKDFRYHGYPEESFFQPRRSNKRPVSEEERVRERFAEVENRNHPYKPLATRDEYVYNPNSHGAYPEYSRTSPRQRSEEKDIPVTESVIMSVKDNFMEKGPWEIEKARRERRDAEEDIAKYRAAKQLKLEEERAEKKKEYERAKVYIWDSKNRGHGAPKGDGDNRKQKFTEEELTPRKDTIYKDSSEFGSALVYAPMPSRKLVGGSGAPIQTNSGSPQTHITLHPSIHFQDKENVPSALTEQLKYSKNGYQREQYGRELLKQSQERELSHQEERIQELKKEIEQEYERALLYTPYQDHESDILYVPYKLKSGDPYGKPGGGAPNKSNSDSFTERKEPNYLNVEEEKKTYSSPRRRFNDYDESDGPYFPFGRPGAGAPNLDLDGNPVTSIKYKLERNTSSAEERRKARAARIYYNELKHEENELKRARQEFENERKAPNGEFATLIKEGQVGKPKRDPVTGMLLNQHLASSDVSKFKTNTPHFKDQHEMRGYHDDLMKQADDRHRSRELNRLKESQLAKQHYDVMGDYWGKFGGGAPKDPVVRKKAMLDQTLYSPGRPVEYHRRNELHEAPREKMQPKNEVRNEVPSKVASTHQNQYDYAPVKNSDYRWGPPYATM